MIIECANCNSRYQYDESRFDGKPSKKIRCAKCQHIFEIFSPAVASSSAALAADEAGDRTSVRRHERPRTVEESLPQVAAPAPGPAAAALQMPQGKRLSLAVIDGPDVGTVFRIEKPRITVGRSGADVNINDNDASRQHAAVEVRETAYTLHDLGSTNGTLVDGQKISSPQELQNHGEFQIGSSVLMLIVTDEM
ncbi:MAG: FHA domain-containing protein [Thermoanaerobaculia bacterium]